MLDELVEFWFSNSRRRHLIQAGVLCVTVTYVVLNTILLGRDEQIVSYEALILIAALLPASIIVGNLLVKHTQQDIFRKIVRTPNSKWASWNSVLVHHPLVITLTAVAVTVVIGVIVSPPVRAQNVVEPVINPSERTITFRATSAAFSQERVSGSRNSRWIARRLFYKANQAFQAGDLSGARGLYEQSIAAMPSVSAYLNASICSYLTGDSKNAVTLLNNGLQLTREGDQRPLRAAILAQIGRIYSDQYEWKLAMSSYREALENAKAARTNDLIAAIEADLGGAYVRQGNASDAIPVLQDALRIARELRSKTTRFSTVSQVLSDLGHAFLYLGNTKAAIDYFSQVLELDKGAGNALFVAKDLDDLAVAYQTQGNYDDAIKALRECIRINESIGNKAGEANALGNLASVLTSRSRGTPEWPAQLEEARRAANNSLIIHKELNSLSGQAVAFGVLGNVYRYQGKLDEALQSFQAGLALDQQVGNILEQAKDFENIGLTELDLKKPAQALGSLRQAASLYRQLRIPHASLEQRIDDLEAMLARR